MAQKRLRRITPRAKGKSGAKNKTRTGTNLPQYRSGKKGKSRTPDLSRYVKLPSGQSVSPPDLRGSAAERSLGALKDMRRFGLSYSEAAKLWHLDSRTFRKYARSGLRDLKSGRVKAMAKDRIHFNFQKPTTQVGEYQTVETRSLAERQLYVQWRIALDAWKRGDVSLMQEFRDKHGNSPMLGGVRLPTSAFELQTIADALEREGSKFEGPYHVRTVRAA